MAHVEDRWMRADPKTGRKTVRTRRYGQGLRWRAVWSDPDGSRHRRSFGSKDVADAFVSDIEVKARLGELAPMGYAKIPFGDWFEEWLERRIDLTPSGRATVKSLAANHILPVWAGVALTDITNADIQTWVGSIRRAPSTVGRIFGVFHKVLEDATGPGRRLGRNPADRVTLPRPAPQNEIRFLTVDELDALIEAMGQEWRQFTRALGQTGLRIGELSELRARDVNLKRARITVSRGVTWAEGGPHVGSTKSKKARAVGLTAEVLADIKHLTDGKDPDDLVYTAPEGGQIRRDNYRRAFLTGLKRSGIIAPGLTVHDLRHTAVSLMVAAGASVKAVQNAVGHAKASMTLDVYAGLFDQDIDEVAKRVTKHLARERAKTGKRTTGANP